MDDEPKTQSLRPSCILFDFDGTLIDTWRLYLEAFRRSLFPHFNRLLSDADILDYQPSAERRLFRRFIEEAHVSGYFDSFMTHYRRLHDTHIDGLYPGVQDMLSRLRHDGLLLGIVTGKSRAAWDITFAKSDLPAFDVIVTDDDVIHPKPHPEGLLAALHAIHVPASKAYYIGDSLLDCQAAQAAGIPFGAALWSKSAQEQEAFRAAIGNMGVVEFYFHPSTVHLLVNASRRTEPEHQQIAKEIP